MTNEPADGQHNAEIVPLHPEPGAPAPDAPEDAPETILAVPAEPGTELEMAGAPAPARAVYADITRVPGERLPVIPEHWHGKANIKATLTLAGAQQWHRARYHGLRAPLYVLAVAVWSVVGVLRVITRQVRWWWVTEQHAMRHEAAAAGAVADWMKLHRQAKADRQFRGLVLLGEAVIVAAAAVALAVLGRWWMWASVASVALPMLARAGRPADRRIISPAIIPANYQAPSHELITDALGSLGIPNINAWLKAERPLSWVSGVMRDGAGWSCQLDLPGGVTATQILAKREELASGLGRPLSATWPAGVPEESPKRLDLWIGFSDISKAKLVPCPLVKARETDLLTAIPFGTNPRGRNISILMFEVNWLLGGSPGQGKTAAVRVIACGAALDPLADLWVHELAGKGDLDPFARVSHRYCSGLDDDALAYAAESARLLRRETERRSLVFKQLRTSGALPDAKVTREAAARHKELRPLVAIFDEVQNVVLDKQLGEQFCDDLAYVIRVGRAYGIVAVLGTQRPSATILPTAITGVVICRFCLMVPDQPSNDLVLGTGARKSGYDATVFRPKQDAGLGWLKGSEGGIPEICRTYYLNLPATERIVERARVARERAGTLTGYALGEAQVGVTRDVLADALAVFGDAKGLQWGTLADRLADRWPDRYADLTADAISAQCRSLGVTSVDVKADGVNVKGCRRIGVEKQVAAARKDAESA